VGTCILKSVPSAIHFIRGNRKCWIQPGVLINSAANTVCNKGNRSGIFDYIGALTGRFFIPACLFACAIFVFSHATHATSGVIDASCNTTVYHETVKIKHVIDGDTVILTDDRHIRLIGINAPEIGYNGESSQPGAVQAQNYLSKILNQHPNIRLHYDAQRYDKYGRTLAHLFLDDGTNIQLLALRQGMAAPLTIPPNLGFLACYQAGADFAYEHGHGIWSLPQYQPVQATQLTPRDLGYRIVTGTISRIGESRSAIWINLAPHVALRIARDDLDNFDDLVFSDYAGKEIRARGFIEYRNREYRMRIRHPVDLNITGVPGGN